MHIPPALFEAHPTIFGRPRPSSEAPLSTLLVALAHPIPLSSLILVALDQASLLYATGAEIGRAHV